MKTFTLELDWKSKSAWFCWQLQGVFKKGIHQISIILTVSINFPPLHEQVHKNENLNSDYNEPIQMWQLTYMEQNCGTKFSSSSQVWSAAKNTS